MAASLSSRDFSYACPEDAAWRQGLIRAIEHVSGKPRLWRLYQSYCEEPAADDFFAEAIRLLELDVRIEGAGLAAIPIAGPLVVVANHPFGVIDGLALGYLISRIRADFKILVHSALFRVPEVRRFLLPIDFAETREALQTNLESRRGALRDLRQGKCIAIFPGGGIATVRNPLAPAVDLEWKTFLARLVHEGRSAVLPVFFEGQNSPLFQCASHINMDLRASLLFREAVKKIGGEVRAQVGEPIPYERLASITDRRALTERLRQETLALKPSRKRKRSAGKSVGPRT